MANEKKVVILAEPGVKSRKKVRIMEPAVTDENIYHPDDPTKRNEKKNVRYKVNMKMVYYMIPSMLATVLAVSITLFFSYKWRGGESKMQRNLSGEYDYIIGLLLFVGV